MNKTKIIKFIAISILAIIMYINFVTIYYSIDTTLILRLGYEKYGINYSLHDGRLFMAGICLLANYTNIPISVFYGISVIGALLISATCVLKIYDIIQEIKPTENKLIKFILLAISYTYIFNFMYIDNMQFIEAIVMAISILLYIIAAEKLILKQNKMQALLLTIIGIFFYQGTINVFISFVYLLAILKHKKINKELLKDIFVAAIITIISVVSSLLVIHIISSNIKVKGIQRASRIDFNIIENIQRNFKGLRALFINSLELFPNWFFVIFTIIQIIIMSLYVVKNKEKHKLLNVIMIVFIYIVSCLFLALFDSNAIHNGNGRVFSSIGALISAMAIYMYCSTKILENTKIFKNIYGVIICIYSIINFYNTFYLTYEAKMLNIYDKNYSHELLNEIKKYEEEKNIKIKNMACKYIAKENEKMTLPKSKYVVSKTKIGNYSEYVLKLYTGRMLKRVEFDEETFETYFSKEKEEIIFIGDTVYFTIEY